MTLPTRRYPDLETVVERVLVNAGIAVHVSRSIPRNIRYRMPFCLIERAGGPDDGWTDRGVVLVDWLSSQPGVAKAKAEDTRDYLIRTSPLDMWPIDRAETIAGPQEIPYGDSAVMRWTTTFEIHTRRVTT
jgi:hypothetical protein